MTSCWRIPAAIALFATAFSSAHALFTLDQGKDLIFVNGSYSIGYDSNVFTRAASKSSFTQSVAASVDYTRQAGLIGVTANIGVTSGQFESVRGQNFTNPSLSVSLRKRYGRTTGTLLVSAQRESQPDPDVGARTQSWSYAAGLDARYPVNDRYYLTNSFHGSLRDYTDTAVYSNLTTYSEAVAINYIYTSKLDLNGAYTLGISDTSRSTKAYDHSFTVGASGSILPKLSGTINVGLERRISQSPQGGSEGFNSFNSGTSLRWMLSRRVTFSGDLTDGFSTTATDVSVNRASAGLHSTVSLSNKYNCGAGIAYTISDFLGKAGAGRRDDMLQFDASIGLAITTHLRTTLAYLYMLNYSNLAAAEFDRQSVTLSISGTY